MSKRKRKRKYSKPRRKPIHRRKRPASISVQGRLVRLSLRTTSFRRGGGSRGSVWYFSRAARKRMLETIARLNWDCIGFVCFVTLTYPDRNGPPTAGETERDRQKFLKRMKRMFPVAGAIWRREWVPRESGEFVGVLYPHYHFLFFRLPFFHYDRLNEMWAEVLGHEGYLRTEIRKVESFVEALGYVAKYMAKPEVGPTDGQGDARREPRAPAEAGRSLVYVAYLTADAEARDKAEDDYFGGPEEVPLAWMAKPAGAGNSQSIQNDESPEALAESAAEPAGGVEVELVEIESAGRSWGTHNKRHLPWAKRRSCGVRAGLWLEIAKRRARQVWAGVDHSESTGFTLFSEDAYKLYEELLNLRLPGER